MRKMKETPVFKTGVFIILKKRKPPCLKKKQGGGFRLDLSW